MLGRAHLDAAGLKEALRKKVQRAELDGTAPSPRAHAIIFAMGILLVLDGVRACFLPFSGESLPTLATRLATEASGGALYQYFSSLPFLRLGLGTFLLLRLPRAKGLATLEASLILDRCSLRLDGNQLTTRFGPYGPICERRADRPRVAAVWEESGELVALVGSPGEEGSLTNIVLGSGPSGVLQPLAQALAASLGIQGSPPLPAQKGSRTVRCPACGAPSRLEGTRKEWACPQCSARILLARREAEDSPTLGSRVTVRLEEGRTVLVVDHGREATFDSRALLAWERFRASWETRTKRTLAILLTGLATLLATPLAMAYLRTGNPSVLAPLVASLVPILLTFRLLRPLEDGTHVQDESWDLWNSRSSLEVGADGSWSLWRETTGSPERRSLGRFENPSFGDLGQAMRSLRIQDQDLIASVGEILLPTEHARKSSRTG